MNLARRGALLLFLFAACAGLQERSPDTITFWAMGHEGEVVGQMMPEFEKRTGIHVRVQQVPWSAAHEKLLTAYVGETTPDVAQMGNTWIPEFAAIDALAVLTDRVANSSIRETNYFPGIWATNLYGGVLYGVPWYVDTRVLFYRTDFVDKPPKTWSEWVDDMARIKGTGRARYAILLPTNEFEPPTVLAMANGSPLLRKGDLYGGFEQPAFRKAFTFYVSLFQRGYAPKVSNTQIANIFQGFEQGDFAMYITGPWNVGEFRNRLSPSMKGKWSTAPMPAPDGRPYPGASYAGGSSLVLFRNSHNARAAWKLIEYLSEPEQQSRFFELTKDLPAHRAAWSTPDLRNDPEMQAFLTQLENVQPPPRVPEWEQIATSLYEHAEQAIRGRMSVPQALADLDHKADEILAKRRWVVARKAEH